MSLGHDRIEMIKTLKEHVVPFLRKSGFTGTFPHFRRTQNDLTDLLAFQFDKYGGGFVMEIAGHQGNVFTTDWGTEIAVEELKTWDIGPAKRDRVYASEGILKFFCEKCCWFRYDSLKRRKNPDRFNIVASLALKKVSKLDEKYIKLREKYGNS